MKVIKRVTILTTFLFILFGCSQNNPVNPSNESANNDENVEFTKYTKTASDDFIDQDAANEAKKRLSKYEEIKSIKAVNTSKYLITAIQVHHNKRFQLEKLQKKYAKTLKEKFPKFQTNVSTDQKMWIELDELENAINHNQISNTKLEKQVKHILHLSREKT
ncbi:hypothetical protein WMZ97_03260 [Lentibacillus sp. N15]|uniref:hypothetical protein n=1 Tax=Lentibacillus songyuanensis TaxID=3136161 RepID=UPI0031BA9CB7